MIMIVSLKMKVLPFTRACYCTSVAAWLHWNVKNIDVVILIIMTTMSNVNVVLIRIIIMLMRIKSMSYAVWITARCGGHVFQSVRIKYILPHLWGYISGQPHLPGLRPVVSFVSLECAITILHVVLQTLALEQIWKANGHNGKAISWSQISQWVTLQVSKIGPLAWSWNSTNTFPNPCPLLHVAGILSIFMAYKVLECAN